MAGMSKKLKEMARFKMGGGPTWEEEDLSTPMKVLDELGFEAHSRILSELVRPAQNAIARMLVKELGFHTGDAIDVWMSAVEEDAVRFGVRLGYALALNQRLTSYEDWFQAAVASIGDDLINVGEEVTNPMIPPPGA